MDAWWIDRPHLLGSRNPTDADLDQLRRDGFFSDQTAASYVKGAATVDLQPKAR